MKIRFTNFWRSFEHSNNFFFRYLQENGYEPEIVNEERTCVDLEFVSVFPSLSQKLSKKIDNEVKKVLPITFYKSLNWISEKNYPVRNSTVRIWYSGENIRPPLTEDFDGFLSFDQTRFDTNSLYFPLWMTHLNWFGEDEYNKRLGSEVSIAKLIQGRKLSKDKEKFAVVFLSNPHPYRLQIIKELSRMGKVDVFGSYSGKLVESKIDIARDYRYSICFENDLYPGYVTEKLLEAYLSETVPLYWGDLGNDEFYNQKSFINFRDFNSTRDLITSLSNHDYRSMYEMGLLSKQPTLDDFSSFMQTLLRRI